MFTSYDLTLTVIEQKAGCEIKTTYTAKFDTYNVIRNGFDLAMVYDFTNDIKKIYGKITQATKKGYFITLSLTKHIYNYYPDQPVGQRIKSIDFDQWDFVGYNDDLEGIYLTPNEKYTDSFHDLYLTKNTLKDLAEANI